MLVGILLSLSSALCSSIGYVTIKKGLETTDYKVFILLGTFLGVAISGPLLWSMDKGLAGMTWKAAFPFIITGGLGGGLLTRIAGTKAVDEIGASRTHALNSASPLVTALLGMFLLQEVINLQLALGMVIVVIGGGFLSYLVYRGNSDNSQERGGRPLVGLSFAFYCMVMYGLHPVLRKIGLNFGATPLQGSFIRFGTGFAFYVAYLLVSRTKVNVKSNQRVFYYLVASVTWAIAPIVSIYAVQFVSPAVFASLIRVGPLFTVILMFIFLRGIERASWQIGLNAALIVIGAIMVSTA